MEVTPPTLTDAETATFLRVAEGLRQQALTQMVRAPLAQSVFAQTVLLQRSSDAAIESAVAGGLKIACRAGCSHCCATRVEALVPEVFAIADALLQKAPLEVAALIERLRTHVASAGGPAPWSQRPPCPLLVDRLCSVYTLRPTACRSAHSLDAKACEAGVSQIPQNLRIVVTALARTKGLSDAVRDIGLVPVQTELVSALLVAMTDPSARGRWLQGEDVFAATVTQNAPATEAPSLGQTTPGESTFGDGGQLGL
jgi:uncharacterized protein